MAPRKLGAKRSKTDTIKVNAPVSELEQSIPHHVKRRADKIHIHPGIERMKDGANYRPANATEGELWEDDWCSRCKHSADENKVCPIYKVALLGNQPYEWLWYEGKPLCKGFEYETVTLDNEWRPHVVGIAWNAGSVDYEPMEYATGSLGEMVANSMMSHWCHACDKKETCFGFQGMVADKTDLPAYWIWVNKHPACTKFMPKVIAAKVVSKGKLVNAVSIYRGYEYWIEFIPGSSLYAGFYQLVDSLTPERLGNDQTSVVMTSMILRDAIDEATGNSEPGEWVKNYLKHFTALNGKPLGKVTKSKLLK